MGIEDGIGIPESEQVIHATEKEKKPIFGFRHVVKARLDATVPFEGAITKIEPKDGTYMYTVVERPDAPEGEQGTTEILSEEDLVRYNQGEMHLWQ